MRATDYQSPGISFMTSPALSGLTRLSERSKSSTRPIIDLTVQEEEYSGVILERFPSKFIQPPTIKVSSEAPASRFRVVAEPQVDFNAPILPSPWESPKGILREKGVPVQKIDFGLRSRGPITPGSPLRSESLRTPRSTRNNEDFISPSFSAYRGARTPAASPSLYNRKIPEPSAPPISSMSSPTNMHGSGRY